jgi:hypothetical protein
LDLQPFGGRVRIFQGAMMFRIICSLFLILTCLALHAGAAGAGDWESCSKALKALNSAANAAGFLAFETSREQTLFKQNLALADKYSDFNDRVPAHRDEYQYHVDTMEAAFLKLQAAMFDAELACYSPLLSQTGKSDHA